MTVFDCAGTCGSSRGWSGEAERSGCSNWFISPGESFGSMKTADEGVGRSCECCTDIRADCCPGEKIFDVPIGCSPATGVVSLS